MLSEKVGKNKRILFRAERVWKCVNIENYSFTDAWLKCCPSTKANRGNCGTLAKRDCDLFEETYGEDIKKLLHADTFESIKMALAPGSPSIYFISAYENQFVKIGYTADIETRLKVLNGIIPNGVNLLFLIKGESKKEAEFHERYQEHRINGEWFRNEGKLNNFIALMFAIKKLVYEKKILLNV